MNSAAQGAAAAGAIASGGTAPNILAIVIPMIIWGILALLVYFIPTFVAYKKQHVQKKAILVLNIFLGWTFVGWVVALIWGVMKDKKNM